MELNKIFCKFGSSSIKRGSEGLLGSLVGAGASLVGSGISADSAASINEQNIKMQRETNEQNYKMFHEQQDFAREMWNKTNEYNSPENVAARLRQVGVNPLKVLAGENGASMQTAGLVGSPQGVPMVAPHADLVPGSLMAQGIERSINSYFQNSNIDSDTKLKLIDAAFRADEHREELNKKKAEILQILSNKDLNEKQRSFYQSQILQIDQQTSLIDTVYNDIVNQYHLNTDMLNEAVGKAREDKRFAKLQADYQNMLNEWFPKQQQAQLDVFKAQTASFYAEAGLKKQMTKTEIYKTAQQITESQIALLRKLHIKIEQNQQDALMNANLEQVKAATKKMEHSDNFIQNYSPFATIGAAATPAIFKAIK